ncbi:unnamed protein product [Dibothriocephalus latus]|uniref:Uncharacterized protein n=1 Tax=Dibothriocephalus latus TaxID=60516 RepID=A0A3P7PIE7_DIBLA|nr:unnamed protein product [Dibothriocephalus latus]
MQLLARIEEESQDTTGGVSPVTSRKADILAVDLGPGGKWIVNILYVCPQRILLFFLKSRRTKKAPDRREDETTDEGTSRTDDKDIV